MNHAFFFKVTFPFRHIKTDDEKEKACQSNEADLLYFHRLTVTSRSTNHDKTRFSVNTCLHIQCHIFHVWKNLFFNGNTNSIDFLCNVFFCWLLQSQTNAWTSSSHTGENNTYGINIFFIHYTLNKFFRLISNLHKIFSFPYLLL